MHRFPIVCRDHFNRVPGATVQKRTVRALANALLAANTEVGIDFDAAKGRMILIRHPEHAGFNWAILDTRRRTRTTGAAVSGDREYARPLFASGLAIPNGHGPELFYDVIHHYVEGRF